MTWYTDSFFYRKDSPDWELRRYGANIASKGDLLYNTLWKLGKDEDTTLWAEVSINSCEYLLIIRQRWPYHMNQSCDANTRVGRWISEVLYNWQIRNTVKYRPQHDMTRDPYIMYYALCMHRGRPIEVKIPWYLFRPSVSAWRKYLITSDEKYLKRYRFWDQFSSVKHDYVQRLWDLREYAIQLMPHNEMGTFDGQVFPIGAKLTSKENGELIIAAPWVPLELIVGYCTK